MNRPQSVEIIAWNRKARRQEDVSYRYYPKGVEDEYVADLERRYREAVDVLRRVRDPHAAKWRLELIDAFLTEEAKHGE